MKSVVFSKYNNKGDSTVYRFFTWQQHNIFFFFDTPMAPGLLMKGAWSLSGEAVLKASLSH